MKSENELSHVPIYHVEKDEQGLYFISCNKIAFELFEQYLETYASDANETDIMNPHVQ